MSSQEKIVQTGALPANTKQPFPSGSNSVYTAGVVTQQNQAQQQAFLAQNGGVKRGKSRRIRGGAVASNAAPVAVAVVPPPASYDTNPAATGDNNAAILALANQAQTNATYDTAKTPGDTAALQAQSNAIYKGGKKKRRSSLTKTGGNWPAWGCLSGGKKSKKNRKTKRRKHRKTKRHRYTR